MPSSNFMTPKGHSSEHVLRQALQHQIHTQSGSDSHNQIHRAIRHSLNLWQTTDKRHRRRDRQTQPRHDDTSQQRGDDGCDTHSESEKQQTKTPRRHDVETNEDNDDDYATRPTTLSTTHRSNDRFTIKRSS